MSGGCRAPPSHGLQLRLAAIAVGPCCPSTAKHPLTFAAADPTAEIGGVVKIELALAAEGVPRLVTLTEAASPDGISFGLLSSSDLNAAVAASSNPAASLKDSSM